MILEIDNIQEVFYLPLFLVISNNHNAMKTIPILIIQKGPML